MPRRLVLLLPFLMAMFSACNRESSPPPQFAETMEGPGGRKLVPMRVPERKDEGLIAPIAAAEQPAEAKEKEKGEKKAGVKVDDSSPVAIARSLIHIVSAADYTLLPEVLVAEQAEGMKGIIESVAPFLASTGALHKAINEKLSGAPVAIELKDAWLQQLVEMSNGLNLPEEPPAEGEESQVTFVAGPADAADVKKIQWTAKKVDDKWKLSIPDFQAPSDAAAVATELEGKTAGFQDLAKRIESEDVKDADAAKAEVEKVMTGKYEPAAGEKKAEENSSAEKPAEEQSPEPEKAAKKPKRQRDDVDDVVSGPTLPRGN